MNSNRAGWHISGAQPPWFMVAMDQILQPIRNDLHTGFANVQANFANVQTSLDAIQTRLTAVENKVQQLLVKQAQVQRYTAKVSIWKSENQPFVLMYSRLITCNKA